MFGYFSAEAVDNRDLHQHRLRLKKRRFLSAICSARGMITSTFLPFVGYAGIPEPI
jgi:hypothetical protein